MAVPTFLNAPFRSLKITITDVADIITNLRSELTALDDPWTEPVAGTFKSPARADGAFFTITVASNLGDAHQLRRERPPGAAGQQRHRHAAGHQGIGHDRRLHLHEPLLRDHRLRRGDGGNAGMLGRRHCLPRARAAGRSPPLLLGLARPPARLGLVRADLQRLVVHLVSERRGDRLCDGQLRHPQHCVRSRSTTTSTASRCPAP